MCILYDIRRHIYYMNELDRLRGAVGVTPAPAPRRSPAALGHHSAETFLLKDLEFSISIEFVFLCVEPQSRSSVGLAYLFQQSLSE